MAPEDTRVAGSATGAEPLQAARQRGRVFPELVHARVERAPAPALFHPECRADCRGECSHLLARPQRPVRETQPLEWLAQHLPKSLLPVSPVILPNAGYAPSPVAGIK